MKLKNLLSIISLGIILLFSCNTKNNNSLKNVELKKDTIFKSDTIDKNKEIQEKIDTTKRKKMFDPRLKVIIDGKIYYKKTISDRPIHRGAKGLKLSKYIYKNMKSTDYSNACYDIRTGKFMPCSSTK